MAYSGTDHHMPPWDWYGNFGQRLFGGTGQYAHAIEDAADAINVYGANVTMVV